MSDQRSANQQIRNNYKHLDDNLKFNKKQTT